MVTDTGDTWHVQLSVYLEVKTPRSLHDTEFVCHAVQLHRLNCLASARRPVPLAEPAFFHRWTSGAGTGTGVTETDSSGTGNASSGAGTGTGGTEIESSGTGNATSGAGTGTGGTTK